MKTYMIGYDLNRPRKAEDYPDLINAIKKLGGYWHHLDSTWIVKTDRPARDIRDLLKPYLDDGDELLVASLTGESAWTGFNDRGSAWLRDNIQPS